MPALPHNFIALSSQLMDWQKDRFMPAVMGLLEEAGKFEQPNVIPVPVIRENNHRNVIALYSVQQGLNVGRRSDFDDVHRLGGRVVGRTIPPARGILEISPFPENFDGRVENQYPWPVSQILWVDGLTWRSLAKDEEIWRERESFSVESLRSLPLDWVDATDAAHVEFYEFLHRALLRWDEIINPETLAQYIASHARSLRLHSGLDVFTADLSAQCGFAVNDSDLGATIMRAVEVLEQIRQLAVDVEEPPKEPVGQHIFTPEATSTLRMLVETAADCFNDDAFVADFCRAFLAELFAAKELPERFDQDSMLAASRQVEAAFNVLPGQAVQLVDGNAGYGDYLIAALDNLPDTANISSILAYEANPVAYQVARLRVDCAMKARKNPPVTIMLHNIYRDGIEELFLSACVFFGEMRPHIIKGTSLEVTLEERHKTRYGWGKKLQNQDLAITRYIDAVETVVQQNGSVKRQLSFRVPAEWAEDMEYAEDRKRFFDMADTVFVDDSGVNEQLVDRRMSRGDIVVLAGDIDSGLQSPTKPYVRISPLEKIGYSLIPGHSADEYMIWIALPELFLQDKPLNGPIERRGMTMIDIERERLAERLAEYHGRTPPEILREKYPAMYTDTKQFNARETRERLRSQGFSPDNITRYSFRPFDNRYVYVKDARPLFSEPATALFALADAGDSFLVASAGNPRTEMGVPVWFGSVPCDYDFFAGRSGHFPVWVEKTVRYGRERMKERTLNISETMREHLGQLGFENLEESRDTAELLWMHALAVLNTPAYLRENREALRLNWPRIPVPGFADNRTPDAARSLLKRSADLGRRVAELLAFDDAARGTNIPPPGQLFVNNRPAELESVGDRGLVVCADWGTRVKGNAVRPRVVHVPERPYKPSEIDVLGKIAESMEIAGFDWNTVFGEYVVDVPLNNSAYWSGVPAKVWEFTIGGRRVLSKWLSYRETFILDRPLFPEEIRFFGEMICRLTKLLLLSVELDRLWNASRGS